MNEEGGFRHAARAARAGIGRASSIRSSFALRVGNFEEGARRGVDGYEYTLITG